MKYLKVFILIVVFCVGVVSAQEINSATAYSQDAVAVVSPKQSGWTLIKSNKLETAFEKRIKDEVLFADVRTLKPKIFEDEQEMLASLETMKSEELLSKYKRDSLHFYYVKFKDVRCVKYDGVFNFKEVTTPKFEYYNFKGYLCRHPENKDLVIQIEFSNHSNLRAFSEDLNTLSGQFFEQIVFSKAAVK